MRANALTKSGYARLFREHIPPTDEFLLILLFLVCADVLFIGLHIALELRLTVDRIFSLAGDRVAGELFQYVKEYWIVLSNMLLFWRTRQPIFVAWALAFAYILADDAMQIHENVSDRLAIGLNVPSFGGLQPGAAMQIVFATVCAVILLSAMAVLYRRADAHARGITRSTVLGLIVLGVFGVGFDALRALTKLPALIVLEEGGELIVMSCICALVISYAWPHRIQPEPHPDT